MYFVAKMCAIYTRKTEENLDLNLREEEG